MKALVSEATDVQESPAAVHLRATMTEPLSWAKWLRVAWQLVQLRVKEYFTSDSQACRWLSGWLGYALASSLGAAGRTAQRFGVLCRLHRANLLQRANEAADLTVQRLAAGREPLIAAFLETHVKHLSRAPHNAAFFDQPARLFGSAILVLKSPQEGEKGLLVANYNHIFPLLAKFFDLERIASRYHIALEPSWSGYCDPDILAYCGRAFPVFVGAYEPRDAAFICSTLSNLVPVGVSTNWWTDHRIWQPLPGVEKDCDVVMLAGWGSYKRHFRFFEALARLRRQGKRLRAMLIGYPVGWTKEIVLNQAGYFGIADQLEVYERVPYERVNALINRAKVQVLWSRKEGVNRAIIEGMFAGLPAIVREGFNYGYRYPYINEATGCFADERGLPKKILEMVERSGEMTPRDWVLQHMSCQRATQILSDAIGKWCAQRGESWTKAPVVKVTQLHGMAYWDLDAHERFSDDYRWITSCQSIP